MKYDMADWDKALDAFIPILASGAFRHGIKTEDVMKELVRLGKFTPDITTMLLPKWKKKSGDLIKLGLYYFAQGGLKNAYCVKIGKSGKQYRVRRFHCVPHGAVEGETDKNGKPAKGKKEGLWLRWEDLNPTDVRLLVRRYRARSTDSEPTKRFLWVSNAQCEGRGDDITLEAIIDDILDAL